MFGGDTRAVTAALAYVKAHGGGTLAISSQSGADTAIIDSGADDVAGIGGFSGRESDVGVAWLARAVADGRIRWVLADSSGAIQDGRTGATTAMSAAAKACRRTSAASGTLYDCQGRAAALAAAG
jgi:hypothetical protein